jgi:microcystin degradation protein MlrC
VTAEVLNITDGVLAADIHDEAQEFGTTALLKVGNVLVGVSRYRTGSVLKPLFWNHLGVDATDRDAVRTVVVKTASNFQYFADWTEELIRVDTPGTPSPGSSSSTGSGSPVPPSRSTRTPHSISTEPCE